MKRGLIYIWKLPGFPGIQGILLIFNIKHFKGIFYNKFVIMYKMYILYVNL